MQPIVFLDFDGPIRTGRARAAGWETDPVAVRVIHNALRDAGARLVVIANLRLSGREACLPVLDSVAGHHLSPFLHIDWCVGGRDESPMGLSRGHAICEWLHGNDHIWDEALIIDDLPIQKYFVMARQAVASVDEGLGKEQLQQIAEWGAEWRSRR